MPETRARGAGWLFLLAVVILILVVVIGPVLVRALDPAARVAYQQRLALQQQQNAAMAPLWLWVWRIIAGSIATAAIAGALFLLNAAVHGSRWLRQRAHLVYPQQGLYPAQAARDAGWQSHIPLLGVPAVRLLPPANEPHAQIVAALVGGHVARFPAGTLRPLLRPSSVDALLPDAEPLRRLPADAAIYHAPLPPALSLPVGVDDRGQAIWLPLRNLGGGIIGGLRGMGKSELVAAMLVGLLRQDAGARVKFALADMKAGLDFGCLPGDLAALQWPVATDELAAGRLVAGLWREVAARQELLRAAGTPNIEAYNAQVSSGMPMPYLLMFVDELMLLTAAALEPGLEPSDRTASRRFIYYATRCLSVGRATGISLIMATQKPSANVVPTSLRDLAGWRLGFRCPTVPASLAVLGQSGAEALPDEAGVALLVRDAAPRRLRAYRAGIEEGAFAAFIARQPRAACLQLPADAEADGLGADDLPDGVAGPVPVPRTCTSAGLEPPEAPLAGTVPVPVPAKLSVPAGLPDAELSARIWQAWKQYGRNINATQQALFELAPGNHGGMPWLVCAYAINTKLGHRHYAKNSAEYDLWLERQSRRVA